MSALTPKLSIITPSFNQSQFLEQTILSVFNQGYPNLEYIIIDGGSTDSSVEIIQKYENRLTFWISETDSGQAEGINKGFSMATGRYIAWINSDDFYRPGAFEEAIKELEKNPRAPFVYSNAVGVDIYGEPTDWPHYRQFSISDLLAFNMIAQPSVFMRSDILKKVGGLNETYHYVLDHKLWIELARYGQPVYVNAYWGCARRHSKAKNSAMRQQFPIEGARMIAEFKNDPKFKFIVYDSNKKIAAGFLIFKAGYLIQECRAKEALINFFKACTLWPLSLRRSLKMILYTLGLYFGKNTIVNVLMKFKLMVRRFQFNRQK